jgi:large subunit ribosomal protein L19
VEKIFPLYSPVIDKIEITKRSKVRRAKLYFIREKVAREVRRQLRNMRMVKMSTEDYKEEVLPEVEEVVDVSEEAPEVVAEATEAEEVASTEVSVEEKKKDDELV